MGNSNYQTGNRFSPLTDTHDDKTINWQNNTMMQVYDAKEMKTDHLTDDTTTHTTNDIRLSIKKFVTQNSSNNPKSDKHANKIEIHVVPPYT